MTVVFSANLVSETAPMTDVAISEGEISNIYILQFYTSVHNIQRLNQFWTAQK